MWLVDSSAYTSDSDQQRTESEVELEEKRNFLILAILILSSLWRQFCLSEYVFVTD